MDNVEIVQILMLLLVCLLIKVSLLTVFLDILLLSVKYKFLESVDHVLPTVFNVMLQVLEIVINAKSAMLFWLEQLTVLSVLVVNQLVLLIIQSRS